MSVNFGTNWTVNQPNTSANYGVENIKENLSKKETLLTPEQLQGNELREAPRYVWSPGIQDPGEKAKIITLARYNDIWFDVDSPQAHKMLKDIDSPQAFREFIGNVWSKSKNYVQPDQAQFFSQHPELNKTTNFSFMHIVEQRKSAFIEEANRLFQKTKLAETNPALGQQILNELHKNPMHQPLQDTATLIPQANQKELSHQLLQEHYPQHSNVLKETLDLEKEVQKWLELQTSGQSPETLQREDKLRLIQEGKLEAHGLYDAEPAATASSEVREQKNALVARWKELNEKIEWNPESGGYCHKGTSQPVPSTVVQQLMEIQTVMQQNGLDIVQEMILNSPYEHESVLNTLAERNDCRDLLLRLFDEGKNPFAGSGVRNPYLF